MDETDYRVWLTALSDYSNALLEMKRHAPVPPMPDDEVAYGWQHEMPDYFQSCRMLNLIHTALADEYATTIERIYKLVQQCPKRLRKGEHEAWRMAFISDYDQMKAARADEAREREEAWREVF